MPRSRLGGTSSSSGTSGSARRRSSTATRSRMSRWIGSVTSQTLTFMPATTRSPASQKAMNSRLAGSPRKTTRSQRAGEARVLHADVVLVGEEVRQAVVGVGAAEHVARRGRALVERVGPVLDADPLAVEGVVGVGDVAGGEDAGRAGLQVLVDEDPVVDGEAGLRGELGARLHADADDDEVAVERAPVAGADALDRACRPRRPRRRSRAASARRGRRGCRGRRRRPRRRARARAGPRAGSRTVTSRPRWRAEAATSAPIQPAPITTTAPPRSSRSRRASESSTLRR